MKAGKEGDAIFKLFSNGYKTSRDAYLYNFSRYTCAENARLVTEDYLGAMRVAEEHPKYGVDEVARHHSSNVRWDAALKDNLRRRKGVTFSAGNVQKTQYRPFVKQYCYVEYVLVNRKYQMDSIFPIPGGENRAICVPGVGSTKPFSVLAVDSMPDLEFISKGQCFPRYRYRQPDDVQDQLPGMGGGPSTSGPERIDNVTDTALAGFRTHYRDNAITKDAIFDYAYGILHAPGYRERFANDLAKALPRIPFAPDFHPFADAGRALMALHLGYEDCEEYPLDVVFAREGEPLGAAHLTPRAPRPPAKGRFLGTRASRPHKMWSSPEKGEPPPEHFRIGRRAMRFADEERSVLIVNDHIRLAGIPPEAHRYEVNGRTPLEWFIDRYRIVQDRQSGIVNDPNAWFDDPRDLIAAFRRIVHVSVETDRIVRGLPEF